MVIDGAAERRLQAIHRDRCTWWRAMVPPWCIHSLVRSLVCRVDRRPAAASDLHRLLGGRCELPHEDGRFGCLGAVPKPGIKSAIRTASPQRIGLFDAPNNSCGLTGDDIGCKGLYGFDIDGDSVLARFGWQWPITAVGGYLPALNGRIGF